MLCGCWRRNLEAIPPSGLSEMSRFARDWAWALQVTPPQKLVILALAERADDGGTCWPSLTHLTEMTGLVRSTVALALIGLEDAHLIS